MRIYSVVSNSLFCLERNPEQKPCYFIFNKNLFGGLIERELLQLYHDSQNDPELRHNYHRIVLDRKKNLNVEHMQCLKKDVHNLYFQLNEGSFEIKYSDGTIETVQDLYTSTEWTDYKDVWTYDKKCEIGLHDKTHFLWLSLIDTDLSQAEVKVKRLKSDGVNPVTFSQTFTGENILFVCGESFEINGNRYHQLDKGVYTSTLQQFDNVTEFSISTETCVSLILVRKR